MRMHVRKSMPACCVHVGYKYNLKSVIEYSLSLKLYASRFNSAMIQMIGHDYCLVAAGIFTYLQTFTMHLKTFSIFTNNLHNT